MGKTTRKVSVNQEEGWGEVGDGGCLWNASGVRGQRMEGGAGLNQEAPSR